MLGHILAEIKLKKFLNRYEVKKEIEKLNETSELIKIIEECLQNDPE